MSKKSKLKNKSTGSSCTLPFIKYNEAFELLKKGEIRNLRDIKSCKNSFVPIEVKDEKKIYNRAGWKIDS